MKSNFIRNVQFMRQHKHDFMVCVTWSKCVLRPNKVNALRIFFSGTVQSDFSLTVKAATLIFISGRDSAISSAKQGKSGSIYNLVKNK